MEDFENQYKSCAQKGSALPGSEKQKSLETARSDEHAERANSSANIKDGTKQEIFRTENVQKPGRLYYV